MSDPSIRSVTIAGLVFSLVAPYAAGHVLTESEAAVLNQTYAENIRNNTSKLVTAAQEEAKKENRQVTAEDLQPQIDAYVSTYAFGVRTVGERGPRLPTRDKIALKLAEDAVRAKLAAQKVKITKELLPTIAKVARELVATKPAFYAEADRQIKATQKAADSTLDDSVLSDLFSTGEQAG